MKQYKIMTDENGDFSLDLPALEKGTYTMKAIFEGDSDAYGSEITKTLIIQGRAYAISIEANDEIIQGDTMTLTLSFEDEDGNPVIEPGRTIKLYQEYVVSDITLTSDKDILSYADNDVATLTAKVTTSSGGIPVGVDVVFKKDGVLLDTVQTNTHGVATYSYASTGAGDITLSAECDLVSEPYPVFDCPVYDGDNTPTSISWSKTNNAVVTDEVVSLIASVLNTNNNPCINIPVVFKQGNTVLGTAYTDCNGDATMTYTWADSDIFNVTAQVGQSLSEDITMFVKDKNRNYLFLDYAVTANHNSNYTLSQNRITKQVTDTHTLLTCTGNYGHCFIINEEKNFDSPCKIEFDIVSTTGRNYFNMLDVDAEARIKLTKGHHIITVNNNGIITATCDGSPITPSNSDPIESLMRLSLFVVGDGVTLSFKNLEIYTI